MPAERYFHPLVLTKEPLLLEGQEFHHLVHVMRAQPGDEIEIINGLGQLAKARILSIGKKGARASIESISSSPPQEKRLILVQAIPRLNRLDFILEKGTELGMAEIWLFPGVRSEKREFSAHQLLRLQTILIAAMKQCGRLFLPAIFSKPPIKQWEELPSAAFFGDTRPQAPWLAPLLASGHSSSNQVLFCVGPESGFSDEEIQLLEGLGAKGVALHANILRTDTAALCALSLLSQKFTG